MTTTTCPVWCREHVEPTYRWLWRDTTGATAMIIDTNRLDAEVRACDLLCANSVKLEAVIEVRR